MNDIILQHYDEIFGLFKNIFKAELSKSFNLNFEDLIALLQKELPDIKFNQENTRAFLLWFNDIYLQDFLRPLFKMDFEEIYFHNNSFVQLKTNNSTKKPIEAVFSHNEDDFQICLEILARKQQIEWNYNSPFVSFNIENELGNFRFSLIHQSTGPKTQSKLFIRKNYNQSIPLENFINDTEVINQIKIAVKAKKNILISGSTGSGKTTLLKSLIENMNPDEHIILIEDTHEINISKMNYTYLQADENCSKKSAKAYCSYAMRMSPDRMIIGELRSNEIIPFLLSMNTGHKGLLSSIHANSAKDVIHRMHLLFSIYSDTPNLNSHFVREMIIKNIDLIIHLENKKIVEIIRPICMEDEIPIVENLFIAC